MNADLFVSMVKRLSVEGGAKSTLSNLRNPPGGGRQPWYSELADWFIALPPGDQVMVERVSLLAAGHAVNSLLCILDGAQAIESGPQKGHLELYYVNGASRILLNDRRKEPLNDKLHES